MDLVPLKKHSLTPAQFEQLADIPPEEEWLANITNLKRAGLIRKMYGSLSRLPLCRIIWGYVPQRGRISSPGAGTWKDAVWRRPPFGASSRRCPRSSITSANATLSPAIR
jgi:hypothetical protein